ncbi:MAG: helix-turn-helix transcriptional regulator, partial [Lachnospiraceae bacterium]|nr:helix-turn-helix transcriptional regulator [Lachnospiraceae bacterium]
MEKKIGITLATYRKAKKLSQIEIADKLRNYGINVSNAAVSAWEKDISVPNAHQFLALCKILEITDIYNEFIGFNPNDP